MMDKTKKSLAKEKGRMACTVGVCSSPMTTTGGVQRKKVKWRDSRERMRDNSSQGSMKGGKEENERRTMQ
jgi:hypothetical protein